jgi:hypothetical protein
MNQQSEGARKVAERLARSRATIDANRPSITAAPEGAITSFLKAMRMLFRRGYASLTRSRSRSYFGSASEN